MFCAYRAQRHRHWLPYWLTGRQWALAGEMQQRLRQIYVERPAPLPPTHTVAAGLA